MSLCALFSAWPRDGWIHVNAVFPILDSLMLMKPRGCTEVSQARRRWMDVCHRISSVVSIESRPVSQSEGLPMQAHPSFNSQWNPRETQHLILAAAPEKSPRRSKNTLTVQSIRHGSISQVASKSLRADTPTPRQKSPPRKAKE